MSRRTAMKRAGLSLAAATGLAVTATSARGASPYLSWQIAPEIERQIERVMMLADRPVLTRPIAVATVLDALPAACERDAPLCESVRRYLRGYANGYGLGYLSAAVAAAGDDAVALPNRRGMTADSAYEVGAQVFWQPGANLLVAGGVIAYDGEVVPAGTVVSLGTEYLQLDVGFRDHWLSPMRGSSMLIGTEAQTMPSVTLSNYTPLTRWGLRYELFVAEMSATDRIAFGDRFTSGNPRLAGVHLSVEPLPGFAIGVNRILQFGGGERSDSFGDLVDAFLRPSEYDNTLDRLDPNGEFGNQAASITSQILIPGSVPFSFYFEYAGEDTSKSSNLHLGNSSLSAGVTFPSLWRRFDLTAEVSEWQNAWYVHGVYLDGLRHEGNVIGHWGADWRVTGDGVGARSAMVQLGWLTRAGAAVQAIARVIDNESYSAPEYERGYSVRFVYSRRFGEFSVGAELDAGNDTFGNAYSRVGAFFRF